MKMDVIWQFREISLLLCSMWIAFKFRVYIKLVRENKTIKKIVYDSGIRLCFGVHVGRSNLRWIQAG